MTDSVYLNNYNRLKHLALDRFVWDNLPAGLEPRHIELALFHHGKAIFVQDDVLGFLCLPCNPNGGMNVYGDWVKYTVFGYNYNKVFDVEDCVLIRNNLLMINTDDYIQMYAKRLTDVERTIDVNLASQKTPYLIACDDKDILTLKNIYKKIDEGEPAIFADKNLNLSSINVYPTVAPYVIDKLTDFKNAIMNETLTFLGINNANTDKRERLNADEVNANNEHIIENLEHMLVQRQLACELINKRWGLNISVKIKESEVEEDGELYSDFETDCRE